MQVVVAAALVGAVALHGLRSPSKSHNAEQVVLTGGESIASDALDPAHHTPRKISTRGVMDSGVYSASGESQPERAELAASDGRRPLLEHPAVHYSVAGRVVTSEGEPAANVEVWIHLEVDAPTKEAREQFLLDHGLETLSPRLRTDPSGSFRFAGLPCVPYSLYVGDSVDGNLPRSELLNANAVLNIKLLHRLGISGRVFGLGGKGGEIRVAPCDTAFESVMGSDGFHSFGGAEHKAQTASDGAYTVQGLQPGWYEVLAHAEGLGTASRRVELTTELEQVDLELSRGLTFAGRVEADFPADRRRSQLFLSPSPVPRDLFGDGASSDGSFRYENLPEGTYELTASFKAAGERRTDVRRTFSIELRKDTTDFHRTVSMGTERVSLQVDGPIGEHYVDGVLTAKGRHGFHSSVVRVIPSRTAGSHGVWRMHEKVFNPTAAFHYGKAFALKLPPGEWEISLDLCGYRPWLERVLVSSTLNLVAQPELLPGRAIAADVKAKDVRVEARLLPDGDWFEILERDNSFSPVLEITPSTSWLPEGRYDLRLSTRSTVEHFIEDVVVKASHRPLVITSPEKEGLRISGRLLSNARSNADVALYLYLKDGDGWRPLPRKTSKFGSAYPSDGTSFHFIGLHPGEYRASVDQAGRQVVSTWSLTSSDLLDELLRYEFR